MSSVQVQRASTQTRITLNRRFSATFVMYVVMSAMLMYGGYHVWIDRQELYAGNSGLWAALLIGTAVLIVCLWQLLRLMRPDVWVINRATGRIENNGTAVGLLNDMQNIRLLCEPDSDHDDLFSVTLVPKRGKPIKIDWGYGREGASVGEVARHFSEATGLKIERENS